VSPGYKEGYTVAIKGISADGSQLRIESPGAFASLENTTSLGGTYLLGRTESEWRATPLDAPASFFPIYSIEAMSSNFDTSLWFASKTEAFSGETDIYRDHPDESFAEEHFSLVGTRAPLGVKIPELTTVGASDNLTHVLLLAHSPGGGGEEDRLWPGDQTAVGRRPSLYEYVGTGNAEPQLVGVSNEEQIAEAAHNENKQHINEAANLISDCGISLGDAEESDAYNAVSADGGTVFFTAEACHGFPEVNELYARIDGEKTIGISEPAHPLLQGSGPGPEECDAACETAPRQAGTFQGASKDGSKVFFLTAQPLLNGDRDAATDLYEAEIGGEGKNARIVRLIQVSRDPNVGQAAEVQGVARVSEDGSHVYFVAKGVLTEGPRGGSGGMCFAELSMAERVKEETTKEGRCSPQRGGANLYIYERDTRYPSGHIAFVVTLSERDGADWQERDVRPVQATPDGRFLVFQSTADLTRDQEGRAEAGQIFEYDAQTEALVRVSRGGNGYGDNGNSSIYQAIILTQNREYSVPEQRYKNMAMSEDGSRVFFSSSDALTAGALLGFNNIYEYRDGRVFLISDGHDTVNVEGAHATELIGTDESGRDVFFMTADQLVPQDTDTQIDLYDARQEGGFAAPEELAPCSGSACRTGSSEMLRLPPPSSTSVTPEPLAAPVVVTHPSSKPRLTRKRRMRGRKRATTGGRSRAKGIGVRRRDSKR
jgi:hypothetical protein